MVTENTARKPTSTAIILVIFNTLAFVKSGKSISHPLIKLF